MVAQTPSADACSQLTSLHQAGLTVRDAHLVPAGPMGSPRGNNGGRPQPSLPSHCEVSAVAEPAADSHIVITLWLPESGTWNGKLLATGNGSYSSALSLGDMAEGLNSGYAVGGSDTGHEGANMSFGVGHPEKIRDWAYRATHELAAAGKLVVHAYYGKPASKAYFQGCSTGGQQALSEAQRYPMDFDGIVAGDPGNDRILLNADFFASWLVMHPAEGPPFPREKLASLGKASVLACDKNDGVVDGVVNDPRTCTFDPASIQCAAGVDTPSCLTPAQVAMVRELYAGPVRDANGNQMYVGWARSSEAGWGPYLVFPTEPTRLDFWKGWVYNDPNYELRSFQPAAAVAAARKMVPYVEATSHNLKAFRDHGGKLLLYQGWADPVVPPENTIQYLQGVQKETGQAEKFTRLFMVPGMGHCSGGPGATAFEPLNALDKWITTGKAPDVLTASHRSGAETTFTRPLCAFPKVAQWDGHGDTATAASFACVAPAAPQTGSSK